MKTKNANHLMQVTEGDTEFTAVIGYWTRKRRRGRRKRRGNYYLI